MQRYDQSKEVAFADLTQVDKVMMRQILNYLIEMQDVYDKFDLRDAYDKVKTFTDFVRSFYLEFVKNRLHNFDLDSPEYLSS